MSQPRGQGRRLRESRAYDLPDLLSLVSTEYFEGGLAVLDRLNQSYELQGKAERLCLSADLVLQGWVGGEGQQQPGRL